MVRQPREAREEILSTNAAHFIHPDNMETVQAMRQSMTRVGHCIDNGPMEGFWGMLKSEMYYLRKFTSTDELIAAIEKYITFYNTKRYQKRLRCMTPMEFHRAVLAA